MVGDQKPTVDGSISAQVGTWVPAGVGYGNVLPMKLGGQLPIQDCHGLISPPWQVAQA